MYKKTSPWVLLSFLFLFFSSCEKNNADPDQLMYRLVNIKPGGSTHVRLTYNEFNLVDSMIFNEGYIFKHSYDKNQTIQKITCSGKFDFTRNFFFVNNLLESIEQKGTISNHTISFEYDQGDRVTRLTKLENDRDILERNFQYNSSGQISMIISKLNLTDLQTLDTTVIEWGPDQNINTLHHTYYTFDSEYELTGKLDVIKEYDQYYNHQFAINLPESLKYYEFLIGTEDRMLDKYHVSKTTYIYSSGDTIVNLESVDEHYNNFPVKVYDNYGTYTIYEYEHIE